MKTAFRSLLLSLIASAAFATNNQDHTCQGGHNCNEGAPTEVTQDQGQLQAQGQLQGQGQSQDSVNVNDNDNRNLQGQNQSNVGVNQQGQSLDNDVRNANVNGQHQSNVGVNANENDLSNRNAQGQHQSASSDQSQRQNASSDQTQTASSSQSQNASNNGVVTTVSSVYKQVKQTASATAAAGLSTAYCTKDRRLGFQLPGFGLSTGGSVSDRDCRLLVAAEGESARGNKAASIKLRCATKLYKALGPDCEALLDTQTVEREYATKQEVNEAVSRAFKASQAK